MKTGKFLSIAFFGLVFGVTSFAQKSVDKNGMQRYIVRQTSGERNLEEEFSNNLKMALCL